MPRKVCGVAGGGWVCVRPSADKSCPLLVQLVDLVPVTPVATVVDSADNGLPYKPVVRHDFSRFLVQTPHILLECSGMADPGALAASLWVDPALESTVYLDAVIAFVDALHIERHLDGAPQRPTLARGTRIVPDAAVAGAATAAEAAAASALRALGGAAEEGGVAVEGGGAGGSAAVHATEAFRQVAFADRLVVVAYRPLEWAAFVAQDDLARVAEAVGTTVQELRRRAALRNPPLVGDDE